MPLTLFSIDTVPIFLNNGQKVSSEAAPDNLTSQIKALTKKLIELDFPLEPKNSLEKTLAGP